MEKNIPTPLWKALFFEKRLPTRYLINKLVLKLLYGIKFRFEKNTTDEWIITEIFGLNSYTPKGFKIKKKDIVIDIGSQRGFFTVYAAKQAKKGKVFSFEPYINNFNYLIKNINLNNLKNVIAYNLGVSGKKQKIKLYLRKDTICHSCIFKSGKSIDINCISLKDIFDNNNLSKCNFLKIDCEGSEYNLLFNAPKEYLDKIQKISMEYHNLDENNNVVALKKFLEKNDFFVKYKKAENYKTDDTCGLLYASKKYF